MRKTMTKEFRTAVARIESTLETITNDSSATDFEILNLCGFMKYSDNDINLMTDVALDHAFAEYHEVLDIDEVRGMIEETLKRI